MVTVLRSREYTRAPPFTSKTYIVIVLLLIIAVAIFLFATATLSAAVSAAAALSPHNSTHSREFGLGNEPDLRDFGGGLSIVVVGRLPKSTFDRIQNMHMCYGRLGQAAHFVGGLRNQLAVPEPHRPHALPLRRLHDLGHLGLAILALGEHAHPRLDVFRGERTTLS